MDLPSISMLFSVILSVVISLYYLSSLLRPQKDKNQSLKTPPGSTGLPFIGETLDFLSNARKGTPENFVLDRMKRYSSMVIKSSLFGERVVIFCSPEANKFIFSNQNKLVKPWWPRTMNILLGSVDESINNDEKSLKLRKTFSASLTMDALQNYVPIMDSVMKQHLRTHWEGRDVVTVHPLAQLYTITLVSRLFLGIEDEENVVRLQKPLAQVIKGVISLPVNIPGTNFYRALKAKVQLQQELDGWIKNWKRDFSESRLSASQSLIANILKETFEEDGIADMIIVLFTAAYDTTSAALACIIMFLGKYPHVYSKVLAEQREIAKSKAPGETLSWGDIQKMKYSWNTVCESLRLHPPAGNFREATSDFTFGDFLIPKGWKLFCSIPASHKNPTYFKDPEKFDPSRFEGDGSIPYSYAPFGGGPHMCPGKVYAKIKILVYMHNLVTKFSWEQIFPDEQMACDPMSRPAKGLPVRLYPHKSSTALF